MIEVRAIYIQVTIDLKNYTGDVFDLQLSNYLSIKKVIDIVWQVQKVSLKPREGYWVRVQNKDVVVQGYGSLQENGITNGDRIEIL
ncbi:putative ubiquitin-like protein YukD [Peribacillus deserti]|uniref:Ubiquitin-like protein YukD n=1 Tax=Peribacillus deserti TaxID=673318 RepID=A0ABS2QMU2_9BACI|nr:EsaB/YukD family protein [Peribacillus deserti]MBM7694486.1 putative ubiquitin-like protein YukD [Peribacillus deserti]